MQKLEEEATASSFSIIIKEEGTNKGLAGQIKEEPPVLSREDKKN